MCVCVCVCVLCDHNQHNNMCDESDSSHIQYSIRYNFLVDVRRVCVIVVWKDKCVIIEWRLIYTNRVM